MSSRFRGWLRISRTIALCTIPATIVGGFCYNEIQSLKSAIQYQEVLFKTASENSRNTVQTSSNISSKPDAASYANVVALVTSAVVNIETTQAVEADSSGIQYGPFVLRRPPFRMMVKGLGSGVIVREDGIVITNNHVIKDAVEIKVVMHDEREYTAKVMVRDIHNDLAALQINPQQKGEKFHAISIADAARSRVGDIVLALGSNLGFRSTVTCGLISAMGRTKIGLEHAAEGGDELMGHQGYNNNSELSLIGSNELRPLIQTDAAVNRGSSGGALVSASDGKLIGINTMIVAPTATGGNVGIAFAIPSNFIIPLLVAVDRKDHKIIRTWDGLGVTTATTTPSLPKLLTSSNETSSWSRGKGVIVRKVHSEGPAAVAGLQEGDRIYQIDGVEIQNVESYHLATSGQQVGMERLYKVIRNNKNFMDVKVKMQTPPESQRRWEITVSQPSFLSGAVVAELSPAACLDRGLDPTTTGVVVDSVRRRTTAHRLGIQPGDLLLSFNQIPIHGVKDLEKALQKYDPSSSGGGVMDWLTSARRMEVKLLRGGKVEILDFMYAPQVSPPPAPLSRW